MLKINPQAISQLEQVPVKRVNAIERLTNHQVLAAELRVRYYLQALSYGLLVVG